MQRVLPHAHLSLVQKIKLHAPYPRRHVACAWPPSGRLHARMEKGWIARSLHATYTYDTGAWIYGEKLMEFGRIPAVYHPPRNRRSLGGRRMSMKTHARLALSSLKYNTVLLLMLAHAFMHMHAWDSMRTSPRELLARHLRVRCLSTPFSRRNDDSKR